MNIDFSLVLFVLSLLTGLIWGIDALFFAKRRALKTGPAIKQDAAGKKIEAKIKTGAKEPILVEYARFLFPVIFIVLLLRGFIVEPFRIPSGSMLPTLEIGDFILVNKFSYGFRWPVLNKKFIDLGSPERGDVVVFRYPEDPSIDYIKRVVGIPGDEIAYYNKVLHVNGKPVVIKDMGKYSINHYSQYAMRSEQLDDVNHNILVNTAIPPADFVVVVPEGKYFAMGDNRDNSRDSRVWGFVPDENLVGKAFFVWMSWSWGQWPEWRRIGTIIE